MSHSEPRLPTYFLSHGGGPWSYMEGPFRRAFDRLEASLKELPRELGGKPRAILMVSGHWESREFAVMSNPQPPMVYDYSGFPPETYRIRYPAPGAPKLAERVHGLLRTAGLATRLDGQQGFDHGTFAPLRAVYPDADVPVIQLSLRRDYDPSAHLAAGRALAPLRDEGVAIIGSGLSYHNLNRFGDEGAVSSHAFDAWLREAVGEADPARRVEKLVRWERAPAARDAHPREDHLVPLFVALGAAEAEPATTIYHEDDFMGGLAVSSFRFGKAIA